MPVIEYKLLRVGRNAYQAPEYIDDGGHWQSQIDGTLIGWRRYAEDVDFHLPDQDRELSKAEFIARQLAIHAEYPMMSDDETPVELTEQQVTDQSSLWYQNYLVEQGAIPTNPTQEDIITLQTKKIALAFAEMEKRLNEAAVTVPIASQPEVTCTFGCDAVSQNNIIGVNTAIASQIPVPNPTFWTPKGFPFPVEITHTELAYVGGAVLNKKNEYYGVYFTHKASILMTSDYGDLVDYDYTTGYE